MMSRLEWHGERVEKEMERVGREALIEVGEKALGIAYDLTPKRTGHAADSLFYVIVDGAGNVIGGNTSDRNGQSVPTDFGNGQSGWLRMVLGANADYFVWIEFGTSTTPARAVLARTLAQVQRELEAAIGRHSGGGLGATFL